MKTIKRRKQINLLKYQFILCIHITNKKNIKSIVGRLDFTAVKLVADTCFTTFLLLIFFMLYFQIVLLYFEIIIISII
jgi:hypothetical protein